MLPHFGAVDWHAVVSVNGKPVGEHKGGHTPFSFDITAALRPGEDQELVVSVWDPTDGYTHPRRHLSDGVDGTGDGGFRKRSTR